ncbi:MAG: hypothetical protein PWR07_1294 [Bacillota bacterium]|nr:hypothetical protein [Bacillota bacterium]
MLVLRACLLDVSTHASAREATRFTLRLGLRSSVSTHASAREATYIPSSYAPNAVVSTHASAREATAAGAKETSAKVFQPTPPRGRRLVEGVQPGAASSGFNPRLRAGGDVCEERRRERPSCFNPRLRAGGDYL